MMAQSKGNWKIGIPGTVVTDNKEGFPHNNSDDRDDKAHYGGYLIAESILKKDDARLISAAPDLLFACQVAIGDIDRGIKAFSKDEKLQILRDAINKALGLN